MGTIFPGEGDLYILYAATGECFLSCSGMVASAAQLPSSRSPRKQLVARRRSWVQNSLSEHLGKQSKSYHILGRLKKKKRSSLGRKARTRDFVVFKAIRLSDQTKHSSSAGRRVTKFPLHSIKLPQELSDVS